MSPQREVERRAHLRSSSPSVLLTGQRDSASSQFFAHKDSLPTYRNTLSSLPTRFVQRFLFDLKSPSRANQPSTEMSYKHPQAPSLSSPREDAGMDLEDAFALRELKDMEMFKQVRQLKDSDEKR
jgi:hypothetical protein